MARKAKCSHCGYLWKTKSSKQYVTCPNCQRKIKIIIEKQSK